MDEQTSQSEIKREEYLTMAQAARVSGYQQDYLGQLARKGKLKAVKSGHNWITTRSAMEAFMKEREAQAAARVNREPKTETVKPEIKNSVPQEITSTLPLLDPSTVHSMHTPVSHDDQPHAPSIPMNI